MSCEHGNCAPCETCDKEAALHARIEALEKERDAMRAALRHEADCIEAAKAEIEAMRAKIERMEQQEPVGRTLLCVRCNTPFDGEYYCPACGHHTATEETVYALHGAHEQEPTRD